MAHKRSGNQKGDTLVEVLMAIVIISVVIVGAITIMNRGLAAAQVALEHSQVRLEVNGQIEMLRYARNRLIETAPAHPAAAQWLAVVSNSNQTAVDYNSGCTATAGKQPFYMTTNASSVVRNNYTPSTPATVALAGQGLWIESVLSAPGIRPAYVDFVVRACWTASGSDGGQQRTVTAVRIYDPSR